MKELLIYQPIDAENGLTAQAVAAQLNLNTEQVQVRINSPGGSIHEALAIYNLLTRQPYVEVHIDGVAASAASIIAMAADPGKLFIADNGLMMIHLAHAITLGNKHDHQQTAAVLDQHDQLIAKTYAKRTGRRAETFMGMMEKETWFNAEDALANGLVDQITKPNRKTSNAWDFARFGYKNAPKIEAPEDLSGYFMELEKILGVN